MKHLNLEQEQIASLCRALGHLCHAGISTGDALSLLAADESPSPEKDLLQVMARHADGGLPLAKIFRAAECFPNYVCDLLEVGERVGRLEDTLHALANYYDGRARLERQLKTALLYPSVLLGVLLAVVVILLVWVLPVFNDVYIRLGSRLTGVAGGLLALGGALRACLPGVCAVLAAAAVAAVLLSLCPPLRVWLQTVWKHRLGDKGLGRQVNTARFTQALAMAMSSGLTDEEAAALAAGLADVGSGFHDRCRACLDRLDEGCSLSSALVQTGILTPSQGRLLEAGTKSGSGAAVMEQISAQALAQSEQRLEDLTGQVEPAVVLVLSLLVGAILLSVMLPLMHIMTAIG